MLVLTRKRNQKITIGKDAEIKISILEINAKYVKIGIDAPKNIPVFRQEIYVQVSELQREAC